jgi:hypothetical protein
MGFTGRLNNGLVRTLILPSYISASIAGGPAGSANFNPSGFQSGGSILVSQIELTISGPGPGQITGLLAPSPGSRNVVTLINLDADNITVVDNSALSSAGNRFYIGGNVILNQYESLSLIYSTTLSRWVPFSKS